MINGKKSLPSDVIDVWPEVFSEVTLNVLPLAYVDTVLINFKDGKSWEIGISPGKNTKLKEFEKGISDIIRSYEDHIDDVDVKINTIKVKRDVQKSIKKMLRKIKL